MLKKNYYSHLPRVSFENLIGISYSEKIKIFNKNLKMG